MTLLQPTSKTLILENWRADLTPDNGYVIVHESIFEGVIDIDLQDRPLQAIQETGEYIDKMWTSPNSNNCPQVSDAKAAFLRVIAIQCLPLSDTQFKVMTTYACSDDPILTDAATGGGTPRPTPNWLYETQSSHTWEEWAFDISGNAIISQFWPKTAAGAYMSDTDYAKYENQRRFNNGAMGLRPRPQMTIICRSRWTYDAAAQCSIPLIAWGASLFRSVNTAVTLGSTVMVPAGVFFCEGVRVVPRLQGWIYNVEVVLHYRADGWEDYLLWHDDYGRIPKEVMDNIPAGMKTPYPTVRYTPAKPYGAVRSEQVRLVNFEADPYRIYLGGFLS
jgi:hypothetical protein